MNKKKRTVIGLLILVFAIGLIYFLPGAFASPIPISRVSIASQKTSYDDKEQGSFYLEKWYTFMDKGKLRVNLDLDTIGKEQVANRNVILVLDVSNNMSDEKVAGVKDGTIEFINNSFIFSDSSMALLTSSNEGIVTDFTSDKNVLINSIDNLSKSGSSNYYQVLDNVDKILNGYSDDRDVVVLFVAGSLSKGNILSETLKYHYLKEKYSFLDMNIIQYHMGNDILENNKKVSDCQYVSDSTNLVDVLKDAYFYDNYDQFIITDYINDEYFDVNSIEVLDNTFGSVNIKENEITWDISNLRSGSNERLVFSIKLKNEYVEKVGMYSLNKRTTITSKLSNEESIKTDKTLVISSVNKVIYDANLPSGCSVNNTLDNLNHVAFTNVLISDKKLVCDGYSFKGWEVVDEEVEVIGSNYFKMPGKNVILRAVWEKFSLLKSMDGKVYTRPVSTIRKVKLYDEFDIWNKKYKEKIEEIEFQDKIDEIKNTIASFDISENKDGSVIAKVVVVGEINSYGDGEYGSLYQEGVSNTYKVYIQGYDKVFANEDSSYLFNSFDNLKSIKGLENFDTSNVTSTRFMFSNCKGLTSLDLSNFDTSGVTTMESMFSGCNSLKSLDLSSFDTSKVTNMSNMFYCCFELINLNLSSFDTSKVTNMSNMFYNCGDLINLDLSNFDTSRVVDMSDMFLGCSGLTSLDLSNFDTGQVTNMSNMFVGCNNLINLEVSNFDTSKVTTMRDMFEHCEDLTNLNLSNFDTSKVTDMSGMFYNCSSLISLDLSNFNMSKVTDMPHMFNGCSSLTNLDFGNFDTSRKPNMYSMFTSCRALTTTITISNPNITSYLSMFYDAAVNNGALIKVNYTTETSDLVDKMIATKSSNSAVVKGVNISTQP